MLSRISGQIGSVTLPPLRERDWPMPLKLCRIQNYQNLLMNRIQTRIPVEYEWVLVPALCGDCGVLSGTNKPEKRLRRRNPRVPKSSQNISNPTEKVQVGTDVSDQLVDVIIRRRQYYSRRKRISQER